MIGDDCPLAHQGSFRFGDREVALETSEAAVLPRLSSLLDLPHRLSDGLDPGFQLRRNNRGYSVQFADVAGTLEHFATLDDAMASLGGAIPYRLLPHGAAHVLHAGGLLIDGRAHLFMGPGHIGKSTLAFHAWMKGHDIISDDFLILTPAEGSVRTTPKPLKLRLGTAGLPKGLDTRARPEDYLVGRTAESRILLLGRALPGMTPIGETVPIAHMHFISRSGSGDTFTHPISKAEAIQKIFEQLIIAPRNDLDVVRCLARLYERGSVSGLHVGHMDLDGALAAIEDAAAVAR